MKKKLQPKAEKAPIQEVTLPANSFTSLYNGWIGFFSSTFWHLGDTMHCMITADIKEGNLYLVLIVQLTPKCSIEVSKVMQTAAGWFNCTATRVRLRRTEPGKRKPTRVMVPSESTQDKKYYVEFFT